MMFSEEVLNDDDGLVAVPMNQNDTSNVSNNNASRGTTAASAPPMKSIQEHEENNVDDEDEEEEVEFFQDDELQQNKKDNRANRRRASHGRTQSMPATGFSFSSSNPLFPEEEPANDTNEAFAVDDTFLSENNNNNPTHNADKNLTHHSPYTLRRMRSSTVGLLEHKTITSDDGASEEFCVNPPLPKEADFSGIRRFMKRCVFLAVVVFAVVILTLIVTLTKKVTHSSNTNTNKLPGGGDSETGRDRTSPTMAPTQEDELLRDKDQFSQYIVQFGIQTEGCQSVTWPEVELSCGEGDSNAVVQILEAEVSKGFNGQVGGPHAVCDRVHANLVRCRVEHFTAKDTDVDYNVENGPLFGVVLVACAGTKDEDTPQSAIFSTLDLKAHVPLDSYATECNKVISSNQMQGETFERHGGHAMPYLSMGRVCRGASFDFGDRRRQLRQASAPQGGDGSLNFNDLFHVRTNFFCEQGQRTTIEFDYEGKQRQQAFCEEPAKCSTLQVCNNQEACSGAPECEVPSGAILVDMVDFVTDNEHEPCFFEQLMPGDWMWKLAASEMAKKPRMDTSN